MRGPTSLSIAALCAGLSMLIGASPALAGGVALEIRNRDAEPLRCVVVLAHFMSMELAPLAPGAAALLEVDRSADGSLRLVEGMERPKAIENLLCGRQQDWAATRADISLSEVRSGGAGRLSTSCTVEERLRCGAWTEE